MKEREKSERKRKNEKERERKRKRYKDEEEEEEEERGKGRAREREELNILNTPSAAEQKHRTFDQIEVSVAPAHGSGSLQGAWTVQNADTATIAHLVRWHQGFCSFEAALGSFVIARAGDICRCSWRGRHGTAVKETVTIGKAGIERRQANQERLKQLWSAMDKIWNHLVYRFFWRCCSSWRWNLGRRARQ